MFILGGLSSPAPAPSPILIPGAEAGAIDAVPSVRGTSDTKGARDANAGNTDGDDARRGQTANPEPDLAQPEPATQATKVEAQVVEQALAEQAALAKAGAVSDEPVAVNEDEALSGQIQDAEVIEEVGAASDGPEARDLRQQTEAAADSGFAKANEADAQAGAAPSVAEARYAELAGLIVQPPEGQGFDHRV